MPGPAILDDGDYRVALRKLYLMMQRKAPKSREIRSLANAIAAYEQHHHPLRPPDPVAAIEVRRRQLGWSRNQVADRLGVQFSVLAGLMAQGGALPPQLARTVRDVLGLSRQLLARRPARSR